MCVDRMTLCLRIFSLNHPNFSGLRAGPALFYNGVWPRPYNPGERWKPLTDALVTMTPLSADATDADVGSAVLYVFDGREHGHLLGVDAKTRDPQECIALLKLELLLGKGDKYYVWLFEASDHQRKKWPGFTSLTSSKHAGVPTCDHNMLYCVITPPVVQNGNKKAIPRAIGPLAVQGAATVYKKLFEPANIRLGLRASFVLALITRVPQSMLAIWGDKGPASGWESSCINHKWAAVLRQLRECNECELPYYKVDE